MDIIDTIWSRSFRRVENLYWKIC